ncbi:uronyl 2-sulfotransferase-like [Saccoglossus kowalevskii]|uniref:Uronyl 2-sulfotransferase-like n=1 Tax=Saccoglossus kowalevskii TaxID=10224 RepID=A0ABM0MW86_SACKO|nr:PREDICTED: uronyl 2-sulfotransferase-like [Saccoglossus kowalevskii]
MLMIRIGRIFISPARLVLMLGTVLFFAVVFKLTSNHISPLYSSGLLDTSLRFTGDSPLTPDMGLPLDPTAAWNESRVIFNRVSKVGSRSLLNVIMKLSQKNKFERARSPVFVKVFLNETGQKIFTKEIEVITPPFIYDRHLDYVDFERHASKPPTWINLTRDPVSRLVSFYYYTRFGDSFSVPEWTGAAEDFNQTFDQCVLQDKFECSTQNTFRVVPYFCGQDDECRTASRWAVEQAKRNVVEKFLFVGITEDFNSTLVVLERLLPQFFEGALESYKITLSTIRDQFKSKSKIEPSEEVLKIQRERMALEVEFYEFVKARMLLIKQQLGIPEHPM